MPKYRNRSYYYGSVLPLLLCPLHRVENIVYLCPESKKFHNLDKVEGSRRLNELIHRVRWKNARIELPAQSIQLLQTMAERIIRISVKLIHNFAGRCQRKKTHISIGNLTCLLQARRCGASKIKRKKSSRVTSKRLHLPDKSERSCSRAPLALQRQQPDAPPPRHNPTRPPSQMEAEQVLRYEKRK